MKPAMMIGILLIVLGVFALAYQGITYVTQEEVVDVGPLKATVERERTVPLRPILGAAALVGGLVLVLAGSRQT